MVVNTAKKKHGYYTFTKTMPNPDIVYIKQFNYNIIKYLSLT